MPKTYSERLIEVLNLAASEIETQINAFPSFVHVPDEVAAEISDAIEYAPVQKSNTDVIIIKALSEIDTKLEQFAGRKEFWTTESMKNDFTWKQVRLFAQNELNRLGLSPTIPNLFWVTYSEQKPKRGQRTV